MMETVRHITSRAGRTKFQAAFFLLKSVQHCQRMQLTGTARITTNTVKDRQTDSGTPSTDSNYNMSGRG
jgi:hypothetical protein